MITLNDLKHDNEVLSLISYGEEQLEALGYTEHSTRHANVVAEYAGMIIEKTGGDEVEKNLAEVAGFLHDIGNAVNRSDHAQSGAILSYNLLKERGVDLHSAAEIMSAIGNHDEKDGIPIGRISASLIIADKADVHRSRVRLSRRDEENLKDDIHDRVNYAVENSHLFVGEEKISLDLTIDTNICPVMDYFEIYYSRMKLCKQSAKILGRQFELIINGNKML